MYRFPTKEQVESIRQRYPAGTRITLHDMADPYTKIPAGTKGTVEYVDDMGQLGMRWDNGSSLALIPGVDSFSIDAVPEKEKPEHSRDLER